MMKCWLMNKLGVAAVVLWALTSFARAGESRVFVETTETVEGLKHIVVIPGLTSSPDVFKDVLAGVNGQYHWVTLAGFGGTAAPSDLSDFIRPAAEDIAAYIEENDLRDVILIGHSMGGVISLLIAAEQQHRIKKILIVDSVPFLAGLMQQNADPKATAQRKAVMRQQLANMPEAQFAAMMRQGLAVQATSLEAQARVWADIERADQKAIAVASSEVFTTDYRDVLPKVKVPATVLVPHNAYSPWSKEDVLKRYEDLYLNLEYVDFKIVMDSRHFIMLDQPDAFQDHVVNILGEASHE